jgi:AAA domain
MKLIFIYGLPATGKFTVAQKLARLTGFKLFHNHLAVDLLLSVFEFGAPEFVQLREQIWLSVFEQAARGPLAGLIFTFAPESTVRPQFIDQALAIVRNAGGEVEFIELTCPLTELKARIDQPSRLRFQKLTSPSLFEQLHDDGIFDGSFMPKPRLTLDTSWHTPEQAAQQILQALQLRPTAEASEPVEAVPL